MSLNYTIQSGDTLIKLADKFETTVDELAILNDIKDADSIQVGQRIVAQRVEEQRNSLERQLDEKAGQIAADNAAASKATALAAETEERSRVPAKQVKDRSLLGPIQGPRQEGQFIEDEEGGSVAKSYRLKYTMKDESGKEVVEEFLTGGVGHRMTEKEARDYPEGTKIPKKVRDEWFKVDLAEAEADADALIPKDAPTEVREIITNMAFNLGRTKLGGFKDMLKAIKNKDYETASLEMMDSKWSAQVGDRAVNLAERMRNVQK